MEQELVYWVVNNGVAVGILIYFLTFTKKSLDNNTAALDRIKEVILKCQR